MKGGQQAGLARRKMPKAQRQELARKAAAARWNKKWGHQNMTRNQKRILHLRKTIQHALDVLAQADQFKRLRDHLATQLTVDDYAAAGESLAWAGISLRPRTPVKGAPRVVKPAGKGSPPSSVVSPRKRLLRPDGAKRNQASNKLQTSASRKGHAFTPEERTMAKKVSPWRQYRTEWHHEDCKKVSVSKRFIFPDTPCSCGGGAEKRKQAKARRATSRKG
jgi:hypothetical protein